MASVNMFDPVSIGSIRTRNRICIPPMVIYHISDETGTVKPQNVEHYRALARGGAGPIPCAPATMPWIRTRAGKTVTK